MIKRSAKALVPFVSRFSIFDCTRLVLPVFVKPVWLNLNVKPYIPNPRRCFHCQEYNGHVTQTCRRLKNGLAKVRVSCGMDNHGNDCPGPLRCYSCGESQLVSSKECGRFRLEKALNIRNQERWSYAEAKLLALTKMSSPGMTCRCP